MKHAGYYEDVEPVTKTMDDSTTSTPSEKDNTTDAAKFLLRKIWQECPNTKTREQCDILTKYVELGTYAKLTRDLARLERKYKKRELTTIDIETAIKVLWHVTTKNAKPKSLQRRR